MTRQPDPIFRKVPFGEFLATLGGPATADEVIE